MEVQAAAEAAGCVRYCDGLALGVNLISLMPLA